MADDLRFELTWAAGVYMSLAVTEPGGFEIHWYFGGFPSPSGGTIVWDDTSQVVSWPPGNTPEDVPPGFTARCIYYGWDEPVDAEFTLRVYRNGVLYQEEVGVIPYADWEIGPRTNYREYALCQNTGVSSHAVGMIEMGASGEGESCIIPNDPPGACWEYGWTWSGNTATSNSNSGYGPGEYTTPEGGFPGRQNLSGVSVYPPDQEWRCEGTQYTEMRTASPSSLWAPMAAAIGQGFGPSDGVCSDGRNAGATWRTGGIIFRANFSRDVIAASITCKQTLAYDVQDFVFIQCGYGSPYPTVTLFHEYTTTRVANFAAALALGPPAGIGAGDNLTIWRQGALRSHVTDNEYAIYPAGVTIAVETFFGTTVGQVFSSASVIQDGPY